MRALSQIQRHWSLFEGRGAGHREVLRTPRKRGPLSPASALEERQTAPPRSPTTKEQSGSDSAHFEEDTDSELPRCAECGRELLDAEPDGDAPERCEDCIPEIGPGSAYVDRLAVNLRQLRVGAGLERGALESRVGTQHLAHLEGDDANNLRLTTALRLTCSLGASIEQLTDRIHWNPGQIVRGFEQRRGVERLSGFFEVVPGNVPAFEPPLPQEVGDRVEAAAIFGANVRGARERRHLTQAELARKAGLGKNGLSLIERGVRETSVAILLALARSLEVPPDLLLGGLVWSAGPQTGATSRARRVGCSLDIAIRRLWNEGKTTRDIAETLGTSPGTISATVHRLRERGEPLGYRRPPTRGVHARARQRRLTCPESASIRHEEPQRDVAMPRINEASSEDIASRIGVNVRFRRAESGLTLRQLAEAAETHFSHLSRIERGRSKIPQLALILKLAGSLNVRCGLLTVGVIWDPASHSFWVEDSPPEPHTAIDRLGANARQARLEVDLSQQALADRASMSRSDLVDFERGNRNFRIFTVVRIASALGISFEQIFTGVANWHFRPLAPPEFLPGERPTKSERDQLLMRLWREGRPEAEIAEALDLSRKAVGPYVRELRDAGEDLPYRRPPRRAVELAARRRRGHSCGASDCVPAPMG
ncbi:MAG: helix-turn-helix domain-containing protein [Solirubrobacterales bacterium]